jgi:hypothetical protein
VRSGDHADQAQAKRRLLGIRLLALADQNCSCAGRAPELGSEGGLCATFGGGDKGAGAASKMVASDPALIARLVRRRCHFPSAARPSNGTSGKINAVHAAETTISGASSLWNRCS